MLRWFAEKDFPVFALGGRCLEVDIAGTGFDPMPALIKSIRKLGKLGHRRMVLITPRAARQPTPSVAVNAFCSELHRLGVTTGDYHVPDWKETPEGLVALMDSLFGGVPPTAILLNTAGATFGVLAYLGRSRLRVPDDVSVVVAQDDVNFSWVLPGAEISCVKVDEEALIRHTRQWVAAVLVKTNDRRQFIVTGVLSRFGSIGPVRPDFAG